MADYIMLVLGDIASVKRCMMEGVLSATCQLELYIILYCFNFKISIYSVTKIYLAWYEEIIWPLNFID